MIPRIKGRGQGCGHRVLSPGRYSAETKKRRSIRPIKTLFRTPRASGGNKKKQKYPRAFPTENPQIGKRGQGDAAGRSRRHIAEADQLHSVGKKDRFPGLQYFHPSSLAIRPYRHPHIYYNKSFPFGQAFFDVFLFAARQFCPNGANPDGAKCPRVPPFIRTYARRFLSGRDTVL